MNEIETGPGNTKKAKKSKQYVKEKKSANIGDSSRSLSLMITFGIVGLFFMGAALVSYAAGDKAVAVVFVVFGFIFTVPLAIYIVYYMMGKKKKPKEQTVVTADNEYFEKQMESEKVKQNVLDDENSSADTEKAALEAERIKRAAHEAEAAKHKTSTDLNGEKAALEAEGAKRAALQYEVAKSKAHESDEAKRNAGLLQIQNVLEQQRIAASYDKLLEQELGNVIEEQRITASRNALRQKELETLTAVEMENEVQTKPATEADSKKLIAAENEAKKQLETERRKAAKAEQKEMFSKENLQPFIKKYFIEISASFLMNRDEYKDKFGIAPFSKVSFTNSNDQGVGDAKIIMGMTPDNIFKFCEHYPDVERFFNHDKLYPAFVELANSGTSLIRTSEKLHLMYLQFHRKDFIKNYRLKGDFDNMLFLVSAHYLMREKHFSKVFVNIPPNIKEIFTEENIIAYLSQPVIIKSFMQEFPNFEDIGFINLYQAIVICFTDSVKNKLETSTLIQMILKDARKISKAIEKNHKK